jgi:hypothetical protein
MGGSAMADYSKMRQRISQLRREQEVLIEGMMRPQKMVRGSNTWHKRHAEGEGEEGLFPGLTRKVVGKSVGRRVRIGHMGWLEPLLCAYRDYRKEMQKLRGIQKEIMDLFEELRYEQLYDYEATVTGHLVPIERESKDGQA